MILVNIGNNANQNLLSLILSVVGQFGWAS